MSNFLKFINDDIDAKKTLVSTMPTRTKTDIKKFNQKIDLMSDKYKDYKERVKKYIDTKSKSFNIKIENKKYDDLKTKVSNLEHVRFILNPFNTYFEKMGFDNLLFEISNYYDFNFNSINEIINKFLNQFELAGINLTGDDFDYTCYVNEYMTSFLKVRNKKSDNYEEVSKIFEKVYWIDPNILCHINSNFRKLIRKNSKRFIDYIEKIQKKVMLENEINSYEKCIDKLKTLYIELNDIDKESINDIINLAKTRTIDINHYFEDSKIRTTTYNSMIINPFDNNDKEAVEKFYKTLNKLKINIEEYMNYIKFTPLIEDFKKEYEKQIPTDDKNSNKSAISKNLKNIESQIITKETKLEKLNKKILGDNLWYMILNRDKDSKQLKIKSVKQAKELYDLYKVYDQECFKEKVLSVLNKSLTMADLLHLYYSFDYFKKMAIKKVFDVNSYDEIIKYSETFDLFAMNPTNIVITDVSLFDKSNISRVIMNKYRLDNINITEESLDPDNLSVLLDKIQLLLRIYEIENSQTTVEKIWFMTQVEIINISEAKKNL
ncbi:MAG: hypothetical protein PHH04_08745 [Thomasclavelia sp.]|nr:hypothetical protein [Thomasclavelia sp.]